MEAKRIRFRLSGFPKFARPKRRVSDERQPLAGALATMTNAAADEPLRNLAIQSARDAFFGIVERKLDDLARMRIAVLVAQQ